MNAKFLSVVSIVLLLVGCETEKSAVIYPPDGGSANAQAKLAEAATSISGSLNQLAAIEKATHPRARIPPPADPDSIGMGKLASVDWTGPLEPLVRNIAHASNYRFRVIGKNPAIPVIVSVYATNMPLSYILMDAGYQAVKKADIVVYPGSRIIELRYRNT